MKVLDQIIPEISLHQGHDIKRDAISILIITLVFLICYNDIIFFPYLLGGIDFQIPISNPMQYFQFGNWVEMDLGHLQSDFFQFNRIFTGILGLISFGNQVVAQKLVISGILFSGIGTYVLLRNHLTNNKPAAIIASLFYMLTHYTIHNYGSGLVWEIAFVPLAINFGINVLNQQKILRNLVLFVVLYSFSIGFGVHALLGIPIVLFLIFLQKIFHSEQRLQYLKKTLVVTALGFSVFLVINPGLTSVILTYFGLNLGDSSGGYVLPEISTAEIFTNYANATPANMLTMAHWSYFSYFPQGGLIMVGLALSGLFLTRNKIPKIVYGFTAVLALFVTYGLLIHYKTSFFEILYQAFGLLALFRGTEGVAPFIILSTAALLAFSLSIILKRLSIVTRLRDLQRKMIVGIILSAILVIFFLYSPAFALQQHLGAQNYSVEKHQTPVPYPPVYLEIIDWLRNQENYQDYRAVLAPSSFLVNIHVPYEYEYVLSPSNGYPETNSFVRTVQDSLLQGSDTWGEEISLASVKYVIVPFVSNEPVAMESTVQGQPRIWYTLNNMFNGDPNLFFKLFMSQSDLKLVYSSASFVVFENTKAVSRVTAFPQAAAIVGDDNRLLEVLHFPSKTNAIPIMYNSMAEVPLELMTSVVTGDTNIQYDQLQEFYELKKSEPLIFTKIYQEGTFLRVLIVNENNVDTAFVFNIIANGDNKLTYTKMVDKNSVGTAAFSPATYSIESNSSIYLMDSIGNRGSNIIVWNSAERSSSGQDSFEVIPRKTFLDQNGSELAYKSFSENPIQSMTKISSSEYIIKVSSDEPFYLFLGESYSQNWRAYAAGKELGHYRAVFGNVFHVSEAGEYEVRLVYYNSFSLVTSLALVFLIIIVSLAILDYNRFISLKMSMFWKWISQFFISKISPIKP